MQGGSHSGDNAIRNTQFVFPNPQNGPPKFPKSPVHKQITTAVICNLFPPITCVRSRLPVVPRTAVPKTTIDEQRQMFGRKNKIRSPVDVLRLNSPSADARTNQMRTQANFCGSIPEGSDARHDVRTFLLTEVIHWSLRFEIAVVDRDCQLRRKNRRNGIADLRELPCDRSLKQEIVRKRLQSSTFPHSQRTGHMWMQMRPSAPLRSAGNDGFRRYPGVKTVDST